jgi:hypothetical protein
LFFHSSLMHSLQPYHLGTVSSILGEGEEEELCTIHSFGGFLVPEEEPLLVLLLDPISIDIYCARIFWCQETMADFSMPAP